MKKDPKNLPDLAPIPRRAKPDRGAPGRAAPRKVLRTVEVEVEILDGRGKVVAPRTEKADAYVRALPDVLAVLPDHLRDAALAYAKAAEEVEAGGASDPAAKVAKGTPAIRKEGRQFHAVRQVDHLRTIEAAVGPASICLGRRRGEAADVMVTRLSILRAVALDGLSVAGLLSALRLGRSAARQKLILASLVASATAIDRALCGLAATEKKDDLQKTS